MSVKPNTNPELETKPAFPTSKSLFDSCERRLRQKLFDDAVPRRFFAVTAQDQFSIDGMRGASTR